MKIFLLISKEIRPLLAVKRYTHPKISFGARKNLNFEKPKNSKEVRGFEKFGKSKNSRNRKIREIEKIEESKIRGSDKFGKSKIREIKKTYV